MWLGWWQQLHSSTSSVRSWRTCPICLHLPHLNLHRTGSCVPPSLMCMGCSLWPPVLRLATLNSSLITEIVGSCIHLLFSWRTPKSRSLSVIVSTISSITQNVSTCSLNLTISVSVIWPTIPHNSSSKIYETLLVIQSLDPMSSVSILDDSPSYPGTDILLNKTKLLSHNQNVITNPSSLAHTTQNHT